MVRKGKVAGLATRMLIGNIGEPWPELLNSLFQASQHHDASQREGAFRIFATTPGIIERQHEDIVQAAFARGFKDDNVAVGRYSMHRYHEC
jgi:hypothetical protein